MKTSCGASVAAPAQVITKDNVQSLSYYEVFGLPDPLKNVTTSSADTIDSSVLTRVYRRLSLLFHPDKDSSPEAREAFQYVRTALDTLLDPTLQQAYDEDRRWQQGQRGGASVDAHDGTVRRQQRAAEDADWASEVLRQRESRQATEAAARAHAAAEKEEAMRRMHAELTSALDTPFAMMESQVVRDWDVDEGLLKMKISDVAQLMRDLAAQTGIDDEGEEEEAVNAAGKVKRHRVEAERDTV